jgi:hypothetical protein
MLKGHATPLKPLRFRESHVLKNKANLMKKNGDKKKMSQVFFLCTFSSRDSIPFCRDFKGVAWPLCRGFKGAACPFAPLPLYQTSIRIMRETRLGKERLWSTMSARVSQNVLSLGWLHWFIWMERAERMSFKEMGDVVD